MNTQTLTPSKFTVEGMQQAQRVSYWGTVAILVALLGAAIWAACAPLNGAVIANGAVKVDSNRKTVQHQEGGIVKTVHVRDGDRIKAGQALITLDDARVSAGFESLRTQLDSERAKLARVSAESSFADRVAFEMEDRRSPLDHHYLVEVGSVEAVPKPAWFLVRRCPARLAAKRVQPEGRCGFCFPRPQGGA